MDEQFLTHIIALAQSPDFVMPMSMHNALNIKRTIDDPDASIMQLAQIIMSEPGLSAEAIAIANSVAYRRSGREVLDVKTATSRLGFKNVRAMAAAGVVRQIKDMAPTPELRKLTVRLWEHVAHVAALSHVIAQRFTHVDPEEAMFAAIIHETAGFFLIANGLTDPNLFEGGPNSLKGWDQAAEVEIGSALLHKIGIPPITMQAISGVWTRQMNTPPHTLADTLLLAHALSPVGSPIALLAGQTYPETVLLDPATQKKFREDAIPEMMSHLGSIL